MFFWGENGLHSLKQTIRAPFATVVGLTIVALDWVKINWSLQIDPIKHCYIVWFLNVAYYRGGKSVDIDILSTHTQMLTQQYWMFQETVITSEQQVFRMSDRQFWQSGLLKEISLYMYKTAHRIIDSLEDCRKKCHHNYRKAHKVVKW